MYRVLLKEINGEISLTAFARINGELYSDGGAMLFSITVYPNDDWTAHYHYCRYLPTHIHMHINIECILRCDIEHIHNT